MKNLLLKKIALFVLVIVGALSTVAVAEQKDQEADKAYGDNCELFIISWPYYMEVWVCGV